jgi:hypothetical protein
VSDTSKISWAILNASTKIYTFSPNSKVAAAYYPITVDIVDPSGKTSYSFVLKITEGVFINSAPYFPSSAGSGSTA